MSECKPCLTCGQEIDIGNDAHFVSDQGDKWGHIVCCGGPEVRTDYKSLPHWKNEAIREWNDQWGNREITRLQEENKMLREADEIKMAKLLELQERLAIAERALEEVAHLFQVHTYNIATRALDEIRKEKG
jgi:hypothetical protein